MGCGGSKTSPEEDEGMQDIEMKRGCTDFLWIPIFAAFWIGMIAVAMIGFNMGKPNKLIYAVSVFSLLRCCFRVCCAACVVYVCEQ